MTIEGRMRRVVLVGMFAAALASSACGPRANQAPPPAERAVAWRRLGSWSGRGSLQTESFTSDTGTLRVRWDTTSAAGQGTAPATAGSFRLEARSAISGRLLQEVVDHLAPAAESATSSRTLTSSTSWSSRLS